MCFPARFSLFEPASLIPSMSFFFAPGAAWQYALCLLMQFQLRRLADAVIYAAAISACAKSDRWQASVMLLVEMQHRQLPRNLE